MNETDYKKRRDALLELMDDGVSVIASAEFQTRSNDTEYPYRQDSNFFYLTGFEEDNALLVLVKGSNDTKSILFVQPKDETMELWSGKRLGVEAAKTRFKHDAIYSFEGVEKEISQYLKGRKTLYSVLYDGQGIYETIKNACKKLVNDRSVTTSPRIFKDVSELIQKMRLVKSEAEIRHIKKAIAITKEAHHQAMRVCKSDMYEYQLQAEIEYRFKYNGAYSDAYTSIVANGNNANTLHYVSNRDTLKSGDLVLIDAGCEYEMYASDITRTFPVNGKFSSAQAALYTMILEVQKEVISRIKPGITKQDLQSYSEHALTQGLIDLGVLQGEVEQLIEQKIHKNFYPHGIGHWMGLDVHDPCPYKDESGEEIVFEPGMVLTIEPGIYIDASMKNVPSQYLGIGIRIEDNILVSEEGHEILSIDIVKEIEAIEALMQNR